MLECCLAAVSAQMSRQLTSPATLTVLGGAVAAALLWHCRTDILDVLRQGVAAAAEALQAGDDDSDDDDPEPPEPDAA